MTRILVPLPATKVVSDHFLVPPTPKDGIKSLVSLINIHFRAMLQRTHFYRWPLPTHDAARVGNLGCPRSAVTCSHAHCCARPLSARVGGCYPAQLSTYRGIEPLR